MKKAESGYRAPVRTAHRVVLYFACVPVPHDDQIARNVAARTASSTMGMFVVECLAMAGRAGLDMETQEQEREWKAVITLTGTNALTVEHTAITIQAWARGKGITQYVGGRITLRVTQVLLTAPHGCRYYLFTD